MTDDHAIAPFSPSQVESINLYQRSGAFHPFTCANRGDSPHRTTTDKGVLVADETGLFCPDCDYEQTWVHGWMADGRWAKMLPDAALRGLEIPDHSAVGGPPKITEESQ